MHSRLAIYLSVLMHGYLSRFGYLRCSTAQRPAHLPTANKVHTPFNQPVAEWERTEKLFRCEEFLRKCLIEKLGLHAQAFDKPWHEFVQIVLVGHRGVRLGKFCGNVVDEIVLIGFFGHLLSKFVLRDDPSAELRGNVEVVEKMGNLMPFFLYFDRFSVEPVHYLVDLSEDVDVEHQEEGEDAEHKGNLCGIQRCYISVS